MDLGVVFDLDGTLVDSLNAHYNAWRDVVKEEFDLDITLSEFRELFGKAGYVIMSQYLSSKGVTADFREVAQKKHRLFRRKYVGDVGLLPGARELLEELADAGIPSGVATNSPSANMDAMLAETGIGSLITACVSADDVAKPKPDPAMLEKAAEMLGVSARECVAVDDAVSGIDAAKTAGMKTVLVLTGSAEMNGQVDGGADKVVKDMTEVKKADLFELFK